MTIRFAGSRFVHERRRRRLAQECGGVSVVPVDEDNARVDEALEGHLPPASVLGNSPVNSIIRPEIWVHWSITLLCLAAWGGMLYLGDVAERTDVGLRDILGIRSGRLTTFFSTVMLLWAGQLSLLIYWYRRKSRNDFQGRYRMWLWIGAMLQMFLAVSATGAHVPYSQYMQQIWPLDVPQYGLLCWLVPVATLSLAMYRLLRIELKRHRSGRILLCLGGIAGVTAAGALVMDPFLSGRWRDLIQVGSATLAHLALATALLMHARYVVHISNEAPSKDRRTRRLFAAVCSAAGHLPLPTESILRVPRFTTAALATAAKRLLPKPRLPKRKRPTRVKSKNLAKKTPKPATAAETTSRSTRPAPTNSKQPRIATEQPSATDTKPAPTSRNQRRKDCQTPKQQRVATAPAANGTSQPPQRSLDTILDEYMHDDELNAEAMRGLSKKQRRRLRKKHRELQRSGR